MNIAEKKIKAKSNPPGRKNPPTHFPIVAIGASAGGIEAVTLLLQNLAPDTGMAYVYIQHLDPTHESLLTEILSKATQMEVVEARNLLNVKPDHVYIIPPNKEMTCPLTSFSFLLQRMKEKGPLALCFQGMHPTAPPD